MSLPIRELHERASLGRAVLPIQIEGADMQALLLEFTREVPHDIAGFGVEVRLAFYGEDAGKFVQAVYGALQKQPAATREEFARKFDLTL